MATLRAKPRSTKKVKRAAAKKKTKSKAKRIGKKKRVAKKPVNKITVSSEQPEQQGFAQGAEESFDAPASEESEIESDNDGEYF